MSTFKKGQKPAIAHAAASTFTGTYKQTTSGAPEPAPEPAPAPAPAPELAPINFCGKTPLTLPAPAPAPARYRIVEGKAVTSKRGILGPGVEVKVEYLTGGAKSLAELVAAGYVEVY